MAIGWRSPHIHATDEDGGNNRRTFRVHCPVWHRRRCFSGFSVELRNHARYPPDCVSIVRRSHLRVPRRAARATSYASVGGAAALVFRRIAGSPQFPRVVVRANGALPVRSC